MPGSAIWWSRIKCPYDGKIMSATHAEDEKFLMFCEKCWYDFESPHWDGVGGSRKTGDA